VKATILLDHPDRQGRRSGVRAGAGDGLEDVTVYPLTDHGSRWPDLKDVARTSSRPGTEAPASGGRPPGIKGAVGRTPWNRAPKPDTADADCPGRTVEQPEDDDRGRLMRDHDGSAVHGHLADRRMAGSVEVESLCRDRDGFVALVLIADEPCAEIPAVDHRPGRG
jgi:hypothetical protein